MKAKQSKNPNEQTRKGQLNARYRAIAVLKAKRGQAQQLLDFALEVLPRIRKVKGLHKVEVNRSTTDPGRLVLYYWWEKAGDSERYVAGPVYASIAPRLASLVEEHELYMTENLG